MGEEVQEEEGSLSRDRINVTCITVITDFSEATRLTYYRLTVKPKEIDVFWSSFRTSSD